jgi:hypothetical protein
MQKTTTHKHSAAKQQPKERSLQAAAMTKLNLWQTQANRHTTSHISAA